jgi:phytoene dehydrogenase-like protein
VLDLPQSDSYVIGAGPNGLSAAILLAQAGCSVTVIEANDTIGGAARSAELTLPGVLHDVGSAVFPLGVGSPFFRTLPLAQHGLEWIQPPTPLAHPLDDGSAICERSLEHTADLLGDDSAAYRELFEPLVRNWDALAIEVLGPPRLPRDPLLMAQFGMLALASAETLAQTTFRTEAARALFAGMAGHAMLAFHVLPSAAFGLLLTASAHAVGWPIARGGAQSITNALASYLRSLGGQIITGKRVESLAELPPARAVLCDITPRQLLRIAGDVLPPAYRRKLERFRHVLGAFKVDWALAAPIPWRSDACRRAGTLHLGGTLDEIAASERAAWNGEHAEHPFVIAAQPSLFDASRAPAGKHTAWAYCHVPNGSTVDMLDRIEAQFERFAPGFRDRILARNVMAPADLERSDANIVGGDINGGTPDVTQLFTRPTLRMYGTPVRGLYLCSASTPPGGGVHGMCGFFAARCALAEVF